MADASDNTTLCFNAAARRATRRLGQLYDDILAPIGLKATQHALLAQIERQKSPTMSQLADAMVMDRSALAHTLAPLEREGWIVVAPDVKDGRSKRVTLSQKGKAKLKTSRRLWQEAQTRFEAAYGKKKATALRASLDEIASPSFAATFVAGNRTSAR